MIAHSFRYPRHSEDIERYLLDLAKLPGLGEDDLAEVFDRYRAGDMEAGERIILAHLRLPVRIACQYTGHGLPLADMISEGNIGLLRAVELYDPSFGTAFHTYATIWIKQRIHRAITALGKAVRIPVWRSQRLRKLDHLHECLNSEMGRAATTHELAERLGIPESTIEGVERDRTFVESIDDVGNARAAVHDLPDHRPTAPEVLDHLEQRDEIMACLDELDDTELQVISLKYGLAENDPESYREMAVRLGRNREWIRKVGERATAKLRQSLGSLSSYPRKLIRERRRRVAERLESLKKSPDALSFRGAVLIPYMETLLPIL